jgi:hypothetical protein
MAKKSNEKRWFCAIASRRLGCNKVSNPTGLGSLIDWEMSRRIWS